MTANGTLRQYSFIVLNKITFHRGQGILIMIQIINNSN